MMKILLAHATSLLLLLSSLLFVRPGVGCFISGTDSGYCTKKYLPSTYGDDVEAIETARSMWNCHDGPNCIPFCGRYVSTYPLCLPKTDGVALPADQHFPNGRFDNYIALTKDCWIRGTAMSTIGSNPGLFSTNADCQDSYTRYLCYLNYPRCDDKEKSLPLCSSVCENFIKSCGLDSSLRSICDNGAAGTTVSGDGATVPITTTFPGQPFATNKFLPKSRGQPDLVCTPSVKNSSSGGRKRWWLLSVMGSALLLLTGGNLVE